MVGAFHKLYSRVLNCLSDTMQIGTFRVSIFHKHAGTEVHNIQIMLFQGIIRRYTLLPEQPPHVKKAIICALLS